MNIGVHVVHIYNGILLSHKKEWNCAVFRDMDGPRGCHTEWSKSEREKQILYINIYIWNLEKWYRWTYLQSRNRDSDVENQHMDTKGGGGMDSEIGIVHYYVWSRWLVSVYCIAEGEKKTSKVQSVCRTYIKLTLNMHSNIH